MDDQHIEQRAQAIVRSVLAGECIGYNNAIRWAAKWIEDSAAANGDPAVIEFARNMAMSIRAHQRKELLD